MADKLTYKGGHTVVNQSGDEMLLLLPKRGGSVHRVPQWWNKKGNAFYIECAIFQVVMANGVPLRLIIPVHNEMAITLEIRHDGAGNFIFPVHTGVDRVGVFHITQNQLFREYQFAKISGGNVLTRSIADYPTDPNYAPDWEGGGQDPVDPPLVP